MQAEQHNAKLTMEVKTLLLEILMNYSIINDTEQWSFRMKSTDVTVGFSRFQVQRDSLKTLKIQENGAIGYGKC